jgi:hypothetical protein
MLLSPLIRALGNKPFPSARNIRRDGTFNIVAGDRDELAKAMIEHDDVPSVLYAGSADRQTAVQKASVRISRIVTGDFASS